MESPAIAYVIHPEDNVATALSDLPAGMVTLRGAHGGSMRANEEIANGHKIAMVDLPADTAVIKYGITIGRTTAAVTAGSWVHLHCMASQYDERSSRLDPVTGAPTDGSYS